jgi:hypothetical protein
MGVDATGSGSCPVADFVLAMLATFGFWRIVQSDLDRYIKFISWGD